MPLHETNSNRWIWYPGDFEIRHALLQNFQREERGFDWPAYWSIDDCNKNVFFYKTFVLEHEESFSVKAVGHGYVEVDGKKYPFEKPITCPGGEVTVKIYVGNIEGLPCAFVSGDSIFSSSEWTASDFCTDLPAGSNSLYYEEDQNPNFISYLTESRLPIHTKFVAGGALYDFERVANGIVKVSFNDEKLERITLCYGESETEAQDVELCYYKQEDVNRLTSIRKRAFRYLFIPNCKPEQVSLSVEHEYLPKYSKSDFCSDDDLMNKIWSVSEESLRLCSDLFFIDGVKRDRWIWSGDAYQCYLINQYMFFDKSLNERTILALRGHDHLKQHINTIVDYSTLWVISNELHFMMNGDTHFLRLIYPKMKSMMKYLIDQTDELGFIHGREGDWIFIDWAEMDKCGALSGEQILLLKAYDSMIFLGETLGEDCIQYRHKRDVLAKNIESYFWDNELGAFIDSYESGKRNVTRHSNIFAIMFNLVDSGKKERILNSVLLNKDVPQIVTPYFKFFESDALCLMGRTDIVMDNIRNYWGEMLKLGATTFWEEFNPAKNGIEHLEMYGDPYGKSLCHAWGASPVYLIGRYILGVFPVKPGYEEFIIKPDITEFSNIISDIPVKDGIVSIRLDELNITVTSTRNGGKLCLNGVTHILDANVPLTLSRTEEQ